MEIAFRSPENDDAQSTLGRASRTLGRIGLKVVQPTINRVTETAYGHIPDQIQALVTSALVKAKLREPMLPTAEQIDRHHLETIESSMKTRIGLYGREHANRIETGRQIYLFQAKAGVVPYTLLHDAKTWLLYANEERNPGPAAGENQRENIETLSSLLASWQELDIDITNQLVVDLHDEFGLTDARDPQHG